MDVPKRGTRVQIVILDLGKYILLKHHENASGKDFWALPGGALENGETEEQGALREAREETGLEIRLLPFKIERSGESPSGLYNRWVTFAAFPISGEAELGYDPEPEMLLLGQLTGLRWQGLHDDSGLDEIGIENIRPVRDWLGNWNPRRRAGALVMRNQGFTPEFLLVSTIRTKNFWLFPQGKVEPEETPEQAAERETCEESGVECRVNSSLGFYYHEMNGRYFRTDVFLADFIAAGDPDEPREVRWVTYEESLALNIGREGRILMRQLAGA